MNRYANPSASEKGFTLLELVISLVMIGIIVLIISGAMRLGLRSIETGNRKIDTLERLRTSSGIINAQIQSEMPITRDDNGEKKFYFEGDAETMQFPTNYSIWTGRNGFVLVKYRVVADTSGKFSLIASENSLGVDESRETYLFTSLDSLSFEYYYKDPTEEEGSWVDEWTDTTTTPTKVRVKMVYGNRNFSSIIPMRTPGVLSAGRTTNLGNFATQSSGSGSRSNLGLSPR